VKVKDLRHLLEGSVPPAPGSALSTSVLKELCSALQPLDELPLVELTALVTIAAVKSHKSKVGKPKTLNEVGVARYLDELNRTRSDNAAFEAVTKRAAKDKTLKLAEAQDLAQRFTGEPNKFKSKTEAFKAILQRQISDKRAAARGSQVSDLF
jgi:hypothetical protein